MLFFVLACLFLLTAILFVQNLLKNSGQNGCGTDSSNFSDDNTFYNASASERYGESADGKNHYEPMVGLLHKKNGRWTCEQDPIVSTLPVISEICYGNILPPHRISFQSRSLQADKMLSVLATFS